MNTKILLVIMFLMGFMSGFQTKEAFGSDMTCHPVVGTKGDRYRSPARQFNTADTWLYGDSITYQTWRSLGRIDGGLAVDAQWGRLTKSAIDALAYDLKYRGVPRTIVLAVGTNDRYHPEVFRTQAIRAMRLIPKRIHIIWVNLYSEHGARAETLNKMINSTRAHVVQWYAAQDGPPSSLLVDGTHVNSKGCIKRDILITQALRTYHG